MIPDFVRILYGLILYEVGMLPKPTFATLAPPRIRHLLTDLEQQISNRFQSANRVRCDKTRVSFQQIWIKIRWREVL